MKPADKRINRGGVVDLQGIKDRCVVEEETGCWVWRRAFSAYKDDSMPYRVPQIWVAPGVLGEKAKNLPAGKVAWLLAGKPLAPGQVVYRHRCGRPECVNPAHAKACTRAEMGKLLEANGRLRGDPRRAVTNAKNMLRMATPADVVRRAEAMFAAGRLQKDVEAELGLYQKTVALIKRGLHPHSAARVQTVRLASVFSLGSRP